MRTNTRFSSDLWELTLVWFQKDPRFLTRLCIPVQDAPSFTISPQLPPWSCLKGIWVTWKKTRTWWAALGLRSNMKGETIDSLDVGRLRRKPWNRCGGYRKNDKLSGTEHKGHRMAQSLIHQWVIAYHQKAQPLIVFWKRIVRYTFRRFLCSLLSSEAKRTITSNNN